MSHCKYSSVPPVKCYCKMQLRMGTIPPCYFKGQIIILFPMVTQDNISQTEPCPLEVPGEMSGGSQTSLFPFFCQDL